MKKDMLHTKLKLLEMCREAQMKMVESSKTAMNEAQLAVNEYGPNKDRYDSFRDQLIGRRDMYASQYQKALSDVNVLEKIDCHGIKEKVEFGAIVISDVSQFIIAISSGKIECNGEIYYAISPAVPLYKAMQDLKAGDSFEFNGKRQTIKELF
ncbi:hypothetical protein ACFLTU_08365 [Bacteroidota bacterium]